MESMPGGGSSFPPTAWTLLGEVARDGPGARAALEHLARLYWKPVYVYLRRKGRGECDAADLVQAFFLHLLEKDLLGRPDPARGRFRGWLRAVLEHFLANEARVAAARKRGGDRRILSLDVEGGEQAASAGAGLPPDGAFDRVWAREVLARALQRLGREMEAAGRPHVLATLRARFGLPGPDDGERRVDDSTLHRARKRLRALVLEEVGDGVPDAAEIADEVADLFRALGS